MDTDGISDDVKEATWLLPAWFTTRMMMDTWTFGLLTDTGTTIIISRISRVSRAADGELWLDVNLTVGKPFQGVSGPIFLSPTSRTEASIAVRHIVAAFELADT